MTKKTTRDIRRIEMQCDAVILALGGKIPDYILMDRWIRDHEEIQPGLGKLLQQIVELLEKPSIYQIKQARQYLTIDRYEEYIGFVVRFKARFRDGSYMGYEECYLPELLGKVDEYYLFHLARTFVNRTKLIIRRICDECEEENRR